MVNRVIEDETTFLLKRELQDRDWLIHKLRGELYVERRKRCSFNLFSAVVGGAIVWLAMLAFAARPF